MAINFNDLNNSGIIGLQPLEGMGLPVNQNIDQAFLFKSAEEKALDQIEDLRKEIVELKRDNTLLSYDVATLTDRIKEMESNAKR